MKLADRYFDEIERLKIEGKIKGAPLFEVNTSWKSNIGAWSLRPLLDVARTILKYGFQGNSDINFLELGSGFGLGAAQAFKGREGIHVTTTSCKAINPYFAAPKLSDLPSKIGDQYLNLTGLKVDDVLKYQEATQVEIFKVLEEPYIEQQYLGTLHDLDLPKGKFDVIYESYGDLHYSSSTPQDDFQKAYFLLSEKGVFIMRCEADKFKNFSKKYIENLNLDPDDKIFFDGNAEYGLNGGTEGVLIIAKAQSSIAQKLKEYSPKVGERVIEVKGLTELIERSIIAAPDPQRVIEKREKLASITEKLFTHCYDKEKLINKSQEYGNLLLEMFPLQNVDSKSIQTSNGVAISPEEVASTCLGSSGIRTAMYVQGIYQAVENLLLKKKGRPITLVYAGCGPYATLLLPLTQKFSSQDLRIVLLEINQESLRHVKNIIRELGIESFFDGIVQCDASDFSLEDYLGKKPDIIITETMSRALMQEPQSAIVKELAPSLSEEGELIPQQVIVKAVLRGEGEEIELGEVVNVGKDFKGDMKISKRFLLPERVLDPRRDYKLFLTTNIQVYGDNVMKPDPSTGDINGDVFLGFIEKSSSGIEINYKLGGKEVTYKGITLE